MIQRIFIIGFVVVSWFHGPLCAMEINNDSKEDLLSMQECNLIFSDYCKCIDAIPFELPIVSYDDRWNMSVCEHNEYQKKSRNAYYAMKEVCALILGNGHLLQNASLFSQLPIVYSLKKYRDAKKKICNAPCHGDRWICKIVASFLLTATDFNVRSEDGVSILHYALFTQNLELAEGFLWHVNERFKSCCVRLGEIGINDFFDINWQTKKAKVSPLHLICAYGNADLFKKVIEYGFKLYPNLQDINGAVALHYLVGRPHNQGGHSLFPQLPEKASQEACNSYDMALNQRVTLLSDLIKNCDDIVVRVQDNNSSAPLEYAKRYRHQELINIIIVRTIYERSCKNEKK